MPVYEYECRECGSIFEAEQRIFDPPLNSCTECGGTVERLISRCSFVLKGDGWYVTDHPSKERKEAMKKGKEAQIKPETKSESKTDKTSSTAAASA